MQKLQYEKTIKIPKNFSINYRDFNTYFPHFPKGKIIRSATFSVFDKTEVIRHLQKQNITTVIDLRAEREIKTLPYSTEIINSIQYIKASFNPWNQPKWFQEKYNFGTNREIAYRFFLKACQDSFKKVVDIIIENDGTTLIHCHAGKDRTGLVLGAIQLLLNCDIEAIKKDYMASNLDSDLTVFQLLFDEVEFHGSIEKFFEYQGITVQQQQELIKKLTT